MNAVQAVLIAERRRLLGPTYSLSYEEPVRPVRASGVWMYDAEGRAYLDAYNNVPVVGHCHPRVVAAIASQAAQLNTNTRYLTEEPVRLAARLLATLPPEIGNLVFTCTGTESNELAVRVCQAVSGGTGVIVTEGAYHGNGAMTAGLSPLGRRPLGRDVYAAPAPVGEAGPAVFLAGVREALARMAADGVKPAALIVDTLFTSDGVVADPPGFLAEAAGEIRAAGGLFIADEVQAGFGRTGTHMWGFARHGMTPDLATFGKPMGNGHPIGALAARPELMARFSEITRYFNTFGGNTVSCAAALAVLDVIEDEELMENARRVGAGFRDGLAQLAQTSRVLGEVRGAGLYLGVDVRPDPTAGRSAAQEVTRIVNAMRREQVLIGATGRHNDMLKIRPPLPFEPGHVALFLEKLETVLRA
jgi:4-aminobutyrate aminotransferase-like enzyme